MTDAICVHTPSEEEEAEYAVRYKEAVKYEARTPIQTEMGKDIIWAPQDGSQNDFMACTVMECLVHGTRGGGKTDSLLMAYAQYVQRDLVPRGGASFSGRPIPSLPMYRPSRRSGSDKSSDRAPDSTNQRCNGNGPRARC